MSHYGLYYINIRLSRTLSYFPSSGRRKTALLQNSTGFEVPLGLLVYDASFSPLTPCATTKVMYMKWVFLMVKICLLVIS